jgi:hypothetical protein
MAIFSDKIINAIYTNSDYTLIQIRYEDGGLVVPYTIDVDPNHSDFQALEAEGWDVERITEATVEFKKAQSAAWNIEVTAAAQKLAEELLPDITKEEVEVTGPKSYDIIVSDGEDKDKLFEFKLWALETDIMKQANKEQKSDLRKARSILHGFSVMNGVISDS